MDHHTGPRRASVLSSARAAVNKLLCASLVALNSELAFAKDACLKHCRKAPGHWEKHLACPFRAIFITDVPLAAGVDPVNGCARGGQAFLHLKLHSAGSPQTLFGLPCLATSWLHPQQSQKFPATDSPAREIPEDCSRPGRILELPLEPQASPVALPPTSKFPGDPHCINLAVILVRDRSLNIKHHDAAFNLTSRAALFPALPCPASHPGAVGSAAHSTRLPLRATRRPTT